MTKRKPRVLFVGTHLPHDAGSRSVAEDLGLRLQARGFRFTITSRSRARARRVAEMIATTWLARNNYDVANVDVYSGSAFRWAEWVTRVMRRMGKPFVITLRGGNLPEFARAQPQRVARLLASAAAVTAPSEYLASALRQWRQDIVVIPNPIDLRSYEYREREKPAPKLVWLRAFHRIYDPVLAVRVLAEVGREVPDASLLMIGPDKDGSLAAVRAAANRLEVAQRIEFSGGVQKSQVPSMLNRGDIFINTTTIDNVPVSMLEAMAAGLPVVSTSVGGIPFLLKDGENGLLVMPGDASAMAQAVLQLLRDPGLSARLSRAARATVESFTWDRALPRWEALLISVAAARPVNA